MKKKIKKKIQKKKTGNRRAKRPIRAKAPSRTEKLLKMELSKVQDDNRALRNKIAKMAEQEETIKTVLMLNEELQRKVDGLNDVAGESGPVIPAKPALEAFKPPEPVPAKPIEGGTSASTFVPDLPPRPF